MVLREYWSGLQMMRLRRGAAAVLILGSWGPTAGLARISGLRPVHYLGNTLTCRNVADGATCRLLLNFDGSYQIFYDAGHAAVPLSVKGPFRFEARAGMYTTSLGLDGNKVCLVPNSTIALNYRTEQADEIYAGGGCYPLPGKAVGESWSTTAGSGHTYTMWLLKGR